VPLTLGVCVEVAVIVIGPPAETPDATPEPLIVATEVLDDPQFTATALDEPSEKCPVAENGCVAPIAIDAEGGATVIEVSVGGAAVIVSCAVPLMLGVCVEVAVIVIGPPAATPVATPDALIVATPVFDEPQFTATALDEPSEK
jgi:hypothetical protein